MAVTVYGASDDLIEIEGDIREEFPGGDDRSILAFSNGVVLEVRYDENGIWRISPLSKPPLVEVTITQAPADDEDNYSDRAQIAGEIGWVVLGAEWAKA